MIFKDDISVDNPIICWLSGGVTSAVACKIAIDWFGKENVRPVFIETFNEDSDTNRFLAECIDWYDIPTHPLNTNGTIETIYNPEYGEIKDVWFKYNSLNTANGAICSSELKRAVRIEFEKKNKFSYQIFGFDRSEINRAYSLKQNYPSTKPIFPLIIELLSKKDCIQILQKNGIDIPQAYHSGLHNNNCLRTGCVQGGIGYWQKMKEDFPKKFYAMAEIEHELTNRKGTPVTMLKDQSKKGGLVFLKPHPDYPEIKDISMMKGRPPKPLLECNGFCGINDLVPKNKTEKEINFQS